jgi:selenium metabolism protein YedF
MEKMIDARGMNCPHPVILTKKALEKIEKGVITAVVDNETAKENIVKLAKSLNCAVDLREIDGDYHISIHKQEAIGVENLITEERMPSIILVTSQFLGKGSEELGRVLIRSFFYSLTESSVLPRCILFLNGGVNLTVEGSSIIGYLRELENRGIEILSCGTCLDYFELKERLAVGGITNMYTIIDKLMKAEKTITL